MTPINKHNTNINAEETQELLRPSYDDPLIRNPKYPGVATQGLRHGVLFSGLGFGIGYGIGVILQPFGKKYKFNSALMGTLLAIPSGILGLFMGRTNAQEAQGQYNYMRDKYDQCVVHGKALEAENTELRTQHAASEQPQHVSSPTTSQQVAQDDDTLKIAPASHVVAPSVANKNTVVAQAEVTLENSPT